MTWIRNLHILQKIAFGYFIVVGFAATLNYIPGLRNDAGLVCGVFELDPFDDLLHVGSALWALWSAWRSPLAAKVFLVVFGALYLGDGVFGFVTGYGYLDFGILRFASEGLDLSLNRVLANLPHIALGGFAVWSGVRYRAS